MAQGALGHSGNRRRWEGINCSDGHIWSMRLCFQDCLMVTRPSAEEKRNSSTV